MIVDIVHISLKVTFTSDFQSICLSIMCVYCVSEQKCKRVDVTSCFVRKDLCV